MEKFLELSLLSPLMVLMEWTKLSSHCSENQKMIHCVTDTAVGLGAVVEGAAMAERRPFEVVDAVDGLVGRRNLRRSRFGRSPGRGQHRRLSGNLQLLAIFPGFFIAIDSLQSIPMPKQIIKELEE